MNSLVKKSYRDPGFVIQWEGDADEDTLPGKKMNGWNRDEFL